MASASLQMPVKDHDPLQVIDLLRVDAGRRADQGRKQAFAQFFTPAPVARFMAGLFQCAGKEIHILDAGAGVGSLFAAAVAELCRRAIRPKRIAVTAYEVDESLAEYLQDTLKICAACCRQAGIAFTGQLERADFLERTAELVAGDLFSLPDSLPRYNCAIINPPYFKIRTGSRTHQLLDQIGVATSNIYTGFLTAVVQLLVPGGELVAITPRSFCNGTYFREFRKFFLRHMSLDRIHVFESRQHAFRDDEVLQENVIIHGVKGEPASADIDISSSTGPEDGLISLRTVPREKVIRTNDKESFIRILQDDLAENVDQQMASFSASLADLGISVSTGRVVDFRASRFLRPRFQEGTVPLIYPTHFDANFISWPKGKTKKANAIVACKATRELLVPNDNYVLVKRFSAKEETRRVVAAIHAADRVPGSEIGFENHLNYFHRNGAGLDLPLAKGLAAFLNSTLVDQYFRQFSGHTQVNAGDLRSLRYPTLDKLQMLGDKIGARFPDQNDLDQLVHKELLDMADVSGVDPVLAAKRMQEALRALTDLGLPQAQLNERSALTLLALLDLKPGDAWRKAANPLKGITPMMDFFAAHYGKKYAPNSRETVRRFTVHQFLDAGLVIANPDHPERPVNSPKAVYQIEAAALELLRTCGGRQWKKGLRVYLTSVDTLKKRYAQEREMVRIPVKVAEGKTITLSPGGQNVLVRHIIEQFAPRFTPGGRLLYVGDTDEKFAYFDEPALAALGIAIEAHGKMPDVILHHSAENWLVLIEAVTSHGPVNPKRRAELKRLFENSIAGLVFVTAFLDRRAMVEYLNEISWETEVWVAESPSHMIHFNGERFLGPY
jgi:adenine-specific DNA-methyltransferase